MSDDNLIRLMLQPPPPIPQVKGKKRPQYLASKQLKLL